MNRRRLEKHLRAWLYPAPPRRQTWRLG